MSTPPSHDCYQLGQLGELLYICSRCGKCYVCDHHSVWNGTDWVWICKATGGKETVIFDGKVTIREGV